MTETVTWHEAQELADGADVAFLVVGGSKLVPTIGSVDVDEIQAELSVGTYRIDNGDCDCGPKEACNHCGGRRR